MWRLAVVVGLISSVGCHQFSEDTASDYPSTYIQGQQKGPPVSYSTPTKIEVQSPEPTVVKAPTPKVIVDQGAQVSNGGGYYAGNCQEKCQPICPPAASTCMAPCGTGLACGEIKDRTTFALVLDSFKISIPCLRIKAIPQPADVIFHDALPPAQGYGNPGVIPLAAYGAPAPAYGAPHVVYGAPPGYGTAPLPGYAGPPASGAPLPAYGAPQMGGQVVSTSTQTLPMQVYMPVQVPMGSGANPAPYGAAPPYCPPETVAEAIAKLKQKQQECQELQRQIDSLKSPDPTFYPKK